MATTHGQRRGRRTARRRGRADRQARRTRVDHLATLRQTAYGATGWARCPLARHRQPQLRRGSPGTAGTPPARAARAAAARRTPAAATERAPVGADEVCSTNAAPTANRPTTAADGGAEERSASDVNSTLSRRRGSRRRADTGRDDDREQSARHRRVEARPRQTAVDEVAHDQGPGGREHDDGHHRPCRRSRDAVASSAGRATTATTSIAMSDSDSVTRARTTPRVSWWTNIAGTARASTASSVPSWPCGHRDTTTSAPAAASAPTTNAADAAGQAGAQHPGDDEQSLHHGDRDQQVDGPDVRRDGQRGADHDRELRHCPGG